MLTVWEFTVTLPFAEFTQIASIVGVNVENVVNDDNEGPARLVKPLEIVSMLFILQWVRKLGLAYPGNVYEWFESRHQAVV